MSRAAKAFLMTSIALTTLTVWGVHYNQQAERDNMYAGVLRDEARQAAKKAEREREFQEQIRRRMYLESQQKVSNPADGSSSSSAAYDAALQKDLKPMDVVEFQGCKTC